MRGSVRRCIVEVVYEVFIGVMLMLVDIEDDKQRVLPTPSMKGRCLASRAGSQRL